MAATYKVISQRRGSEIRGDGAFVNTWEVTYQHIPTQTTGIVIVPVAQYTAENVQRLIEAEIQHIDAVANL